jgi:hypothetical protein
MTEERCGTCIHFHKWEKVAWDALGRSPQGVCVAPRPSLGPEPNREVHRNNGAGCPMWTATRQRERERESE